MKNRIISLLTALLMLFAAFPLVPGVFAAGPAAENTMATAQSETGEASVLLLAEPKYFIDSYYIAFCGKYFINKNYKEGYDALVDCYGKVVWETKQSELSLQQVNSCGFVTASVGGSKGQIFNVRGQQLSDGKYRLANARLWRDCVTGRRDWMCAAAYDVKSGKQVGYQLVSSSGQCMLAEEFGGLGSIHNGLITYKHNGKWGLKQLYGKDLISCGYDRLDLISKNRLIAIKNGKGYILDTAGKTVKALGVIEDYEVYNSNDSRVQIRKNGLWGVVDGSGKELIPCAYERLYYNNYALAERTYTARQGGSVYCVGEGSDGIKLLLGDAETANNSAAYAMPFGNGSYLMRSGSGFTVVDRDGNNLLPQIYDYAEFSGDGNFVALCANPSDSSSSSRFAVYQRDSGCVLSGDGYGLALDDCIVSCSDQTVRFYSTEGALVKTIQNVNVYQCADCLVLLKNGKYAVVDHKGKLCTDFIYDNAYMSGMDKLVSMKKGDVYYLLNDHGTKVLDYPMEDAWLFSNEDNPEHYAAFKYKGKFGFIQYAENKQANPFADVQESDPYYSAVQWAVYHKPYQVTAGIDKTHFGPDKTVTRAQAMTFFWAAKDRPKFKTASTQFVDVKKTDWYYKAVMWAVENGITAGTDATHFSPNKTCNRGEILGFLYAALKKPKVSIANPYKDVTNQWYKKAALWAFEQGIERGEKGRFNASTACTRASTVTYLYRFLEGKDLAE